MAIKMIRVPLDIIVDSVNDIEEKKVKTAYLTNEGKVFMIYEQGFRETTVDFDINNIKNQLTKIQELVYSLFNCKIPDTNDKNKRMAEKINMQQNYQNDTIGLLLELESYIRSFSILLSAKIYKELRKYVSERTIEDFIMSKGLHSLTQLIEKPIEEIYKTLNNYEEHILIPSNYCKRLYYI